MELICERGCGLRVHDRYFLDKTQFTAGICPNCNGPIKIVDDHTDKKTTGATLDLDPASGTFRRVLMS